MLLRRKAISTATDEELVARVRDGRQEALALLWDRYAHLLFGVGLKYMKDPEKSKDAVVELFGKLPRTLQDHDVERFRPWIHAVMRNECYQILRKTGREVHDDLAIAREPEPEPDDRALHEATLQELERAIDRLNDQQRICIRPLLPRTPELCPGAATDRFRLRPGAQPPAERPP
jgi:RNA polymerase sigma-70 factor (ECF subfamily)